VKTYNVHVVSIQLRPTVFSYIYVLRLFSHNSVVWNFFVHAWVVGSKQLALKARMQLLCVHVSWKCAVTRTVRASDCFGLKVWEVAVYRIKPTETPTNYECRDFDVLVVVFLYHVGLLIGDNNYSVSYHSYLFVHFFF